MTEPAPSSSRRLPARVVLVSVVASAAVAALVGWWVASRTGNDDGRTAVQVEDFVQGAPAGKTAAEGQAVVGSKAPELTLELLDGSRSADLDHLAPNQPVVLNFWSSTCGPCVKEMPAIEQVHRAHGDVAIIGIDVGESVENGRRFVEKVGVTYTQGRDPASVAIAAFGGQLLPHTVVLDRSHKVVAIHSGAMTERQLTDLIGAAR